MLSTLYLPSPFPPFSTGLILLLSLMLCQIYLPSLLPILPSLLPFLNPLSLCPNIVCNLLSNVDSGSLEIHVLDPLKNQAKLESKIEGDTKHERRTCNLIVLAVSEDSDSIFEDEFDDLPELMPVLDSDDEENFGKNYGSEEEMRSESSSSVESWSDDDELDNEAYTGSTTYDGLFNGLVVFFLDNRYSKTYPLEDPINWNEDTFIFPARSPGNENDINKIELNVYGAYKRVAQKVHPVSGTFPEEARVRRSFPHNPLDSLPRLTSHPPTFTPSERLSEERMKELDVNPDNFLWPEEEKLFQHILKLNEVTLPYEEKDRGTLEKEYFSDYIMPTVPHTPWEYKHIPIPPGIRDKVIEMLNRCRSI
jgi:hypothetical protein